MTLHSHLTTASAMIVLIIALISCSTNQLAVVKLNGKFGCIDRRGKIVIQPTWDEITQGRKNKQILVKKDSLYSFIDKRGNLIINRQYKDASIFYEGRAFIGDGKKFGFINIKGDTVVPLMYDYVFFGFSEGLSDVTRNDSCGYIDKNGKVIIPLTHKMCYPFIDGLAEVEPFESKSILINKKGETFEYNADHFKTRKAWGAFKAFPGGNIHNEAGRGKINEKGDTIIPPIYDFTGDFVERRCIVLLEALYGVYDDKGNIIVEPRFDYLTDFSGGLAHFDLHGKCGYINRRGAIVIGPNFEHANKFSKGLAYVVIDGKAGFIDRNGKVRIKPMFEVMDRGSTFK